MTPAASGQSWWICALLIVATLAAYSSAGSLGFVNLDDDAYVEFQPMVNQGLRSAAWVWAWTATHSNNWHPFTSLSHVLDCSLFGLQPGPMHWENVSWHVVNTLLVFFVWQAATKARWRSALVAGLFALHPAHVESVAWISERKDLLCTFFWLLTLAAYRHYSRSPSPRRYAVVMVCFILSLLSKPMAVTIPVTLLLFDLWPLERWRSVSWRRLVWEKIALFLLAGLHAGVTIVVQFSTGASNYGERLPLAARLGNAVVSCVRYLGESVWPTPLAPHYDHPGWWPRWTVAGAAILLLILTSLAWQQRRTRPWMLFGWGWFLITLAPVIGIIQVGAQAMADRYTYVSYLGLFTVGGWLAGNLATRFPRLRLALAGATALLLIGAAFATHRQSRVWQDSTTLYERSIAAGVDNATLRYLLAMARQSAGEPEAVVAAQLQRALAFDPGYTNAHTQLAIQALRRGEHGVAEKLITETIRLEPGNPALIKNLGVLRNLQGRPIEALDQFRRALELDPHYADARREIGWMHFNQSRWEEARQEFEAVVRALLWDASAQDELGVVYLKLGGREEARRCFERALWINPKFAEAELHLRQL